MGSHIHTLYLFLHTPTDPPTRTKQHTTQEREKRGDVWTPRFFVMDENEEEFPGEVEGKECPHWKWNGEYYKIKDRGGATEGGGGGCMGWWLYGVYIHCNHTHTATT